MRLYYRVEKMRFANREYKINVHNQYINIANILFEAYGYVVNGKSVMEWMMEWYQIKVDREVVSKTVQTTGQQNMTNEKYIFNLLLSIINMSVKTEEIVESRPEMAFKKRRKVSGMSG